MKKIIVLSLIMLILIFGCDTSNTPSTDSSNTQSNDDGNTQNTVTQALTDLDCSEYSDSNSKISCQAFNAGKLQMCDPITKYALREICILEVAEKVSDQSQLADCSLSKNKNNKITCEALLKKNVDHCLTIEWSGGGSADIQMRDCIELVARKMKDKTVCQIFKTNSQALVDVCGSSTSSCKGLWVTGAKENIKHCKSIVR